MSDVEDDDISFVSQVIGIYNMMKTIPQEGLGRLDYTDLSNFEYESVTYFSGELAKLYDKR